MARNKFDVDENLESPFNFAHLKRAMKYVKKHAFKMVLALVLSCIASVVALFGPKIMQWALDLSLIHISLAVVILFLSAQGVSFFTHLTGWNSTVVKIPIDMLLFLISFPFLKTQCF